MGRYGIAPDMIALIFLTGVEVIMQALEQYARLQYAPQRLVPTPSGVFT